MAANTTDLKLKVQRMMNALVGQCAAAGFPIRVTQGVRTIKEQDDLYAQGRSRPGPVVTNAKGGQSFHNFDVAFDVCFESDHPYVGPWDKVIQLATKIGLENGDRGYKDTPHFEVRMGYSLQDFKKGMVDWSKFA